MLQGIVKAVLSGDSLIVMGVDASKGPPPEKLLTLSGISAPRLGNRGGVPDQPFGWGAREFLRSRAIGKKVSFVVEAQHAANREFGSVFLEDGTSLARLMVTFGWARLKAPAAGEPRSAEYEELAALSAQAEAGKLGLFNSAESGSAVRQVQWAGTFDHAALFEQLKGAPQDAIIEQVASGSTLRVLLLPGFHQITLMLSGIACAGFKRLEDGTEEAAPYAREARYFVEVRMLHRDVQVKLEGLDKNGALLGTVLHPQGNMSVELVKVGLARVVEWSSQVTEHAPALRAAERAAKEKRLRLWRDYTPPNFGGDMAEFAGRVVEIVSGDTLVVADASGAERRLSLSSLRCPRMGKEPEPYAAESKEALRKLLIGKKVVVKPEYKRTFAAEGATPQERTFATVLYNSEKNAAEALVSEGLATVARHGQADERSLHYEALLEAEAAAAAAKKGIHAAAAPPRAAPTDLTIPAARERAKRYLSALQRHSRVRAVVQFIANGARFKLLIPKENCVISFACAGIRCPKCARRDTGADEEPFGNEALAFTRGVALQRDVEIEVETVDKIGTFLGALYLPDKRNLSVLLLEQGLASVVGFASEALVAAEATAKAASLKIWEGYSAERDAEAAQARAAEEAAEMEPLPDAQKQMVKLSLTEIVDGAHFYAQVAGETAIGALQEQLAAACRRNGGEAAWDPKVGALVCARFTVDDEWYRAKVKARAGGEYTVFFIDYGNTDVVDLKRLKPLDPTLGPQAVAPQAMECRLAYLIVSPPDDEADGAEAVSALGGMAWGKPMLARVEDRDAGVLLVTLFDEAQTNVNEKLVQDGLARVQKKTPKRAAPLVKGLYELELVAKTSHLGMWRYGDIEEEEAPEFGVRKPAPAPGSNPWKK
ncbi:hypothetical protein AB1Y20_012749 [Prymnesium parvum]|uniref:Uncharacterized protein n=1 Tax=Prymnesium parvum TaxID=97485 RepID=A0AB34IIR4_PRYPA